MVEIDDLWEMDFVAVVSHRFAEDEGDRFVEMDEKTRTL
jgi:hypothetical protein